MNKYNKKWIEWSVLHKPGNDHHYSSLTASLAIETNWL